MIFPDTTFAKLAEDIGGFGVWMERTENYQGAKTEASNSGKPPVVNVVANIEGIAPPKASGLERLSLDGTLKPD